MRLKKLPAQKLLHAIMDYDPESGIFRWKFRIDYPAIWNRKCAGKIAGTPSGKGTVIFVNDEPFYAHRLAWVYVNGDTLDTETQVDHRNCDCFDNRISNLRKARHGQNGSNSRGWRKKKLPKGVSTQTSGGYRARIGVDGKVIHIGTYGTIAEAHAAYCAAAVKAKGEFARAR